MFVLGWIRQRHEELQLLAKKKAREVARRIQREKHDQQQARALLFTLQELQRTIDPLIAAQVYNQLFCPLTRLPEELLLSILDFLSDDVATLHCLQIVSRTFLRLLYYQSDIWKSAWYVNYADPKRDKGHSLYLHGLLKLQFRRLLQRDGRCKNCKRWNDAYSCRYYPFDDCKFQQHRGHRGRRAHGKLYCNPCGSCHYACQFSSANQYPQCELPQGRRCLGQQGSVQLCQHVHISWASIQAYIDEWRQQRKGGESGHWQAYLDSFNIECHHASHDTRCTASEAPTWPRARLRTRNL